jgi:hypothetical protein
MSTTRQLKREIDGATVHTDDEGKVIKLVLPPSVSVVANFAVDWEDADIRVRIMHLPRFVEDDNGSLSLIKDMPTEIDGDKVTEAVSELHDRRHDPVWGQFGGSLLYEGEGYLIHFDDAQEA